MLYFIVTVYKIKHKDYEVYQFGGRKYDNCFRNVVDVEIFQLVLKRRKANKHGKMLERIVSRNI